MDLDDEIKNLKEVILHHQANDKDFMHSQYEANRKELVELKDSVAKLYSQKAVVNAYLVWDEKGLTNADMDKWLAGKQSITK